MDSTILLLEKGISSGIRGGVEQSNNMHNCKPVLDGAARECHQVRGENEAHHAICLPRYSMAV